jgi:hypothetical protein
VAPLAHELNQLARSQSRDRKPRAHAGRQSRPCAENADLRAVNEAGQDQSPLAEKLREQTGIMKDQVQYYLDRARAAARAASIGSVTEIDPSSRASCAPFPRSTATVT